MKALADDSKKIFSKKIKTVLNQEIIYGRNHQNRKSLQGIENLQEGHWYPGKF